MNKLLEALLQLGTSLWDLLIASLGVLAPWTPLAAWVIFWLLAVNWVKYRETLAKGGWIGVLLIGAVAVLAWGNIAPGGGGFDFFGLKISNFVEKTVYVSGLACIMFLAGALQLSGFCSNLCQFEEPILIADTHGHGAHGHGADSHGGHGTHG
ncbi:MAG: hypothetical protein EXS05_21480 [Planctomycetaceae bacterium]|nr:hypothetical protein [Planctomycetaceae bacterium]